MTNKTSRKFLFFLHDTTSKFVLFILTLPLWFLFFCVLIFSPLIMYIFDISMSIPSHSWWRYVIILEPFYLWTLGLIVVRYLAKMLLGILYMIIKKTCFDDFLKHNNMTHLEANMIINDGSKKPEI